MSDICFCTALCGCFLGSIYLWPKERNFALLCLRDLKEASRDSPHRIIHDDPSTVQRRMVSFLSATGVSMALLEYLLRQDPGKCNPFAGSYVFGRIICSDGTILRTMTHVAETCLATLVLFSGSFLEGVRFPRFSDTHSIVFLRNYVIAPFGEEIFFRALLLQLLRRRPVRSSIIISSLMFALCHVHLIFTVAADECQCSRECDEADHGTRIHWKRAMGKIVGVLGCTFTYGLLSGYYYTTMCAKNILATILSHSICNMLGPPPLRFITEGSTKERLTRALVYGAGVVGWALILSNVRKQ